MITHFRVQNYKALRDVSLDLGPIHVLIGPNDSGKTSILEALTALGRLVDVFNLLEAFPGRWEGRELVWKGQPDAPVSFHVTLSEAGHKMNYGIGCRFSEGGQSVQRFAEEASLLNHAPERANLTGGNAKTSAVARTWRQNHPDARFTRLIHDALARMQGYRWVPAHLTMPVVFDFTPRFQMLPSGFGLPIVLHDIQGYDHELFGRLERRFRDFFPSVSKIRLIREPGYTTPQSSGPGQTGAGIHLELAAPAGDLPARQASDGLLLLLAYLALFYSPDPPRLLLIEEPENGIHPRRLQEVIAILKELVADPQSKTQIVLTTHSPYVVDLFKPSEVTLCLKGSDGAVTTHRLSESKSVREQMDIFQLGEIWTAEGDEALAARDGHN